MKFIPLAIPDVILIEPAVFNDPRGFFMETFRADQMAKAGIDAVFVQDNHSGSRRNVLRGLHYQIRQAQGKLVRVVNGEIFDVAVDMRRRSSTFGRWIGEILASSNNRRMLWVPPGFAHGFYVLSEWAEVLYKTTEFYAPEGERTLIWNDQTIGIHWPILAGMTPDISPKDASGAKLEDAECYE
jgi:dTDP-4-dehydrorhamnose 3,5-epimerase